MAKLQNLSVVEEEIFKFIRTSFHISVRDIKPELEKLLLKLNTHQNDRFETRAFVYLDVISWLESKLENIPVQDILKRKFAGKRKALSSEMPINNDFTE
jgi:hypothetical protein